MLLSRYDPPAHLPDFDHIPDQLQQWSDFISGWVDDSIASEVARFKDAQQPDAQVQFYNATKTDPGPGLDQVISWNAFPRTLLLGYGGREHAYPVSEELISLTAPRPGIPTAPHFYQDPPGTTMWSDLRYRPLDEYCEWRVERDPGTANIRRITFTSEPPEYWQALHGDELQDSAGTFKYPFRGDRQLLLELYREYVSPAVRADDLVCAHDYYYLNDDGTRQVVFRRGDYNPYNRWNSTDGIMHLAHPNNFIAAEIQLGADATVLRQLNGQPVVQADALVCGAGFGGTSRSSDPTIGASVNDLARLGAWVTIQNPIGLYMHDLNTQGFSKPNGEPVDPQEYFRVLRGDAATGMIERAVFEVPAREGFSVSDLRIGGVPIRWGGQVAEHLNISITGTAAGLGHFRNPMLPLATYCGIDATTPRALTRALKNTAPLPPGYRRVFEHAQGTFGNAAQPQQALQLARAVYEERRPGLPHKHR